MKLREVWESYSFYTEKITEQTRKLAFAAAGICWFFKTPDIIFPSVISGALFLVVLFFIFDLAQYFVSAIILKIWARRQEISAHKEKDTIDVDVDKPASLDIPGFVFFCLKVAVLFFSYLLIGFHIIIK